MEVLNVWKNEDVPQKLKVAVIAVSNRKGEQYIIMYAGKHILTDCLIYNLVISDQYSFKCK